MEHCTAQPGRWPDASADVSSDEMDEYLAHADECPYHAELQRREFERELRTAFRLAQGLDDDGRVLLGDELRRAVFEQERQAKKWEASGRDESPFGLISLYHGGRLIACAGKFNHTFQQTLHDLDPRVGLQIRARCGLDTEEEVLLGFYALRGVRHDGEEMTLSLDNDYTVGLSVKQQPGETSFFVCFRCFETHAESSDVIVVPDAPEVDPLPKVPNDVFNTIEPWPGSWYPTMPLVANWQVKATAGALTCLAMCVVAFFVVLGANGVSRNVNANTPMGGGGRQALAEPHKEEALTPTPIPAGYAEPEAEAEVKADDAGTQRRERREAARIRRYYAALKKMLTRNGEGNNPQVAVHESWYIFSSCQRGSTDIEIKHSGNDPILRDQIRSALAEPGGPCKEVSKPGAEPEQPVYFTLWRVTQRGDGDHPQSGLEMEVRTPTAYNYNIVLNESARLTVPFSGSPSSEGVPNESVVKNAFVAMCDFLFRREYVLNVPVDNSLGLVPSAPEQDGVQDMQGKGSQVVETEASVK